MISTRIVKSLDRLQGYLDRKFPGCLIMPCSMDKTPKYAHKDGQWTQEKAKRSLKECLDHGALILLTKDLIVIDIDEEEWVGKLETMFPEMCETIQCKTRKGKHYYFSRTPDCELYDSVRKMKTSDDTGNITILPIDIKTVARTGTKTAIAIPPSANKAWIRQLGVDGDPLPIPQSFLEYYNECTTTRLSKVAEHKTSTPAQEIEEILGLLKPYRADGYDDWIRVGWCLHNIDQTNNLALWKEFSKQSPKYAEGICEELWNKMVNKGLGIGTIHMWAKQDSPYEYKAFLNKRVSMDIENCNGSHNAVAAITYKLLKGRFVCATANGKLWYEFTGTLWEEDKEAVRLRHNLSTTVREHFLYTMNKISARLSVDDMQSQSSNQSALKIQKEKCTLLLNTAFKLQETGFKDCVVKEMREYFYDPLFIKKLDSNPNLIAFTNGVWELKEHQFRHATPEDYLTLNVGFDYMTDKNNTVYSRMYDYWQKLHPNTDQCAYLLKTFARQLQGDVGQNLFHIHAGYQGTAGNGKSTFFDIVEMCLGNYIRKFGVEMLTAKQRIDPGKPMPEFQHWKGIRILYCTEPKHDDILNTGIMKDLTGGEKIIYRLLFSNEITDFRPQFKMHIMCNDAPQVDGSDSGVKRRIRKVDYKAQFVPQDQVDEKQHMYLRDDTFIIEMRKNPVIRMEFLRLLLDHYDHEYQYTMPDIVKRNSVMYLEENDNVFKFVSEYIKRDPSSYFTLKQAKEAFKSSDYFNGKLQTLKNDLQKLLKVVCEDQCKINGVNVKNVFSGYKLSITNEYDDIDPK